MIYYIGTVDIRVGVGFNIKGRGLSGLGILLSGKGSWQKQPQLSLCLNP